jgi:uncharacterized protein
MPNRVTQFIVKISKFCNLRCRYCYEMEELGSKVSMSREQLQRIYRHIESYYGPLDAADQRQTEVRFIWHGGEPLLIQPQRFWDTFADQRAVFGDRKVQNLVQTNLTVLDADRIKLLREGFDGVGVSLDLFGGLRVNLAGRDSGPATLRNLDVLRKEDIRFGCITVLTRKNIDKIAQICRFYEQAAVQFRLLPLFDGAYEGQHEDFNVSSMEILEAFKTVFDLWLKSERGFQVIPISQHIESVVHHLTGVDRHRYYNKAVWNSALLINTNGDCYSSGDPYGDPDWALGNLFASPLGDVMSGPRWDKSVDSAERRLAYSCVRCRFFGSCSGQPLVEDETNCREVSPEGIRMCVVERLLLEYIEARLRQLGLPDVNALKGKFTDETAAAIQT